MKAPDSVRLFFALLPEPEAGRALRAWQREVVPSGVRATHRDDLHLTLQFLGQVPAERVPALIAVGDSIEWPAFEFRLGQLGTFRKARVLWLGPHAQVEALNGLQHVLADRLQGLGLVLEGRTFRPHVTLARKVARCPQAPELPPIHWMARRWALLESRPGRIPLYRPLKSWWLAENFH